MAKLNAFDKFQLKYGFYMHLIFFYVAAIVFIVTRPEPFSALFALLAPPIPAFLFHRITTFGIRSKQTQIEAKSYWKSVKQSELNKIRSTMTPAEWAIYKAQLDTNANLEEIKRRQNQPKFGIGFFTDLDG